MKSFFFTLVGVCIIISTSFSLAQTTTSRSRIPQILEEVEAPLSLVDIDQDGLFTCNDFQTNDDTLNFSQSEQYMYQSVISPKGRQITFKCPKPPLVFPKIKRTYPEDPDHPGQGKISCKDCWWGTPFIIFDKPFENSYWNPDHYLEILHLKPLLNKIQGTQLNTTTYEMEDIHPRETFPTPYLYGDLSYDRIVYKLDFFSYLEFPAYNVMMQFRNELQNESKEMLLENNLNSISLSRESPEVCSQKQFIDNKWKCTKIQRKPGCTPPDHLDIFYISHQGKDTVTRKEFYNNNLTGKDIVSGPVYIDVIPMFYNLPYARIGRVSLSIQHPDGRLEELSEGELANRDKIFDPTFEGGAYSNIVSFLYVFKDIVAKPHTTYVVTVEEAKIFIATGIAGPNGGLYKPQNQVYPVHPNNCGKHYTCREVTTNPASYSITFTTAPEGQF